jgi:hypothetical protein
LRAHSPRISVICGQEYYVESESLDGDGALRDWKLDERSRPTTTVVVAWTGTMSELEQALGGLSPRCHDVGAELIVVGALSTAERRRLGRVCPQARVIDAPARLSHKQLREIGAGAAGGDIIVLIDDQGLIAPRTELQLPMSPVVETEREAEHSNAGLTRWLEAVSVSAKTKAGRQPVGARPRSVVARWVDAAVRLTELSRVRLLRPSRAARS